MSHVASLWETVTARLRQGSLAMASPPEVSRCTMVARSSSSSLSSASSLGSMMKGWVSGGTPARERPGVRSGDRAARPGVPAAVGGVRPGERGRAPARGETPWTPGPVSCPARPASASRPRLAPSPPPAPPSPPPSPAVLGPGAPSGPPCNNKQLVSHPGENANRRRTRSRHELQP